MAAMVRWVEDMATVVQKDAKCESACFALFAAGHRRYVDPASDRTQIGVHSIYELIRQEGAKILLPKKRWGPNSPNGLRLLKMIGVQTRSLAR